MKIIFKDKNKNAKGKQLNPASPKKILLPNVKVIHH